jgi:hypothetical protein
MATTSKPTGVDPEVLADIDALMRHLTEKTPVDPILARRAEERADQLTEQLRQKQVRIDIEKLLQDARDDTFIISLDSLP